jgi:hypothetical protein
MRHRFHHGDSEFDAGSGSIINGPLVLLDTQSAAKSKKNND